MSKTIVKTIRREHLSDEETFHFRKQWGVPDWRKAGDYPRNDDALSLFEWKWEFLRRDARYRRDWLSRERSTSYAKYNLKKWFNPRRMAEPEFIPVGCYLIEFMANELWPQALHYEALKLSLKERQRIFSIDLSHPLKPQVKYITEIYKAHGGNDSAKLGRKKIQRSRSYLLRVLDASNEGVSIGEIMDELHTGEPISEKSMRKTVAFAKDFWKRL